MASSRVNELEQEIANTRLRLDGTIDRIQEKLTVSGIVDEVMGQAGVPRLASGHDFLLTLLRRHPVPVMIAAAGLGLAVYTLNKRAAAERRAALPPRIDDGEVVARLPTSSNVRVYGSDPALTGPSVGTGSGPSS